MYVCIYTGAIFAHCLQIYKQLYLYVAVVVFILYTHTSARM